MHTTTPHGQYISTLLALHAATQATASAICVRGVVVRVGCHVSTIQPRQERVKHLSVKVTRIHKVHAVHTNTTAHEDTSSNGCPNADNEAAPDDDALGHQAKHAWRALRQLQHVQRVLRHVNRR